MELILHPSARNSVDVIKQNGMPQALLLTGPSGVGLKTIALEICGNNLPEIISPMLKTKTSTIPTIGIDTIRELYESTRTKSDKKQYVLIDDADAMSLGAQNSFLKLLEEPNPSTYFILTSHRNELLLPTIRSRLQAMHIPEAMPQQIDSIIRTLVVDEGTKKQIQFIARGLPAEALRLVNNKKYFELAAKHTVVAKKLIESSPDDMLADIIKLPANRAEQLSIVERTIGLLALTPSQSRLSKADQLLSAYELIRMGANAKLQIAKAMLQ